MSEIEQALKERGIYMTKTQGDSMNPMLYDGSRVIITPPHFPLKKYDVPVYRRGDHYTMHRIVGITRKGYVICGDNRICLERDITDDDIIGVLSSFYNSEGNLIECTDKEYIRYAKKVCRGLPLRRLKHIIHRIMQKFVSLLSAQDKH